MARIRIVAATVIAQIWLVSTSIAETQFSAGMGTDLCRAYVAKKSDASGKKIISIIPDERDDGYSKSTAYLEWLLGFITGQNEVATDRRKKIPIDANAVDFYVRNWCEQNPSSDILTAVHHYLERTDP
jgi:hypothetical protein